MQTTYTYDAMSRLAAIAGLGKSAAYTRFAESNRLNTVNFGASYPQVNYSYDAQLRMTSKGMWTRTFNAKDEVTQIAPVAGSGVGNLNWYYSYDAAGQLSQGIFGVMGPSGPAGTTYNYSYDQIGNHQLSGVTYNTVNQPSNLTYDANGNMTAKDGKQYIYDGENRLVRILENFYDAWEQGVEFHYDYAGRCYQRNDVFIDHTDSANNYNTPYEYIIYDGAKQVMTLNGDKNVTGKYVWQPESSGDADVILWDQDGVYSTDCNKNVVAYNIVPSEPGQPGATYYDYTPFGAPVGNASLSKRFMFSSEEWFPVRSTLNYDLLLYLYRAYSPALARFLTRDPIAEQGGVNLYNFVNNNPVTRWDSLGLRSVIIRIYYDKKIQLPDTMNWSDIQDEFQRVVDSCISKCACGSNTIKTVWVPIESRPKDDMLGYQYFGGWFLPSIFGQTGGANIYLNELKGSSIGYHAGWSASINFQQIAASKYSITHGQATAQVAAHEILFHIIGGYFDYPFSLHSADSNYSLDANGGIGGTMLVSKNASLSKHVCQEICDNLDIL